LPTAIVPQNWRSAAICSPHRRWTLHRRAGGTIADRRTGVEIDVCPCCGGQMLIRGVLPPRPPVWCDSS
jgi:TFIIB-like protein